MNKYVLPKIVNIIIIAVFIIPLTYGLYVNDWGIQRYLGFLGPEVVIDVDTSIENVKSVNNSMVLSIEIGNIGNIQVIITGVQGILNISIDNRYLVLSQGVYQFIEPHKLDPGDSIMIEIEFPIRELSMEKISLYRLDYRLGLFIEGQVLGK